MANELILSSFLPWPGHYKRLDTAPTCERSFAFRHQQMSQAPEFEDGGPSC